MEIPNDVRRSALFPYSDLLPLPESHPTRRVTIGGVAVQLPGNASGASVWPEQLDEASVEAVVGEVRQFLRDRGRIEAIWMVAEAAAPVGLAERLLALGMTPNEKPPSGARAAAMVALEPPPPPGPPDVTARRAATLDEFIAGQLATVDAFGMDEAQRRTFELRAENQWKVEHTDAAAALFVATLDGEIIASARALFGQTAAFLTGGGTRPEYRGRGAYRALVRARWDAAADRGIPALTTSAGAMSRPILERLGFTTVGWIDCLRDDLTT